MLERASERESEWEGIESEKLRESERASGKGVRGAEVAGWPEPPGGGRGL